MRPLCFLTPILILCAGVVASPEQCREPLTPRPPYIAPVPGYGHWVVTLIYSWVDGSRLALPDKSKAGTAEQIPRAIDIVKTDKTKRVTLSFKDGTSHRIDQVNGYILTISNTGPQIFTASPDMPPYPFYTEGFLFVENVGPATFSGMVSIKGKECFHYQDGTSEAWIDIDSMLPVAARKNGYTVFFQFLEPPTAPIVLTSDEAAVLERQEKAHSAAQSMR